MTTIRIEYTDMIGTEAQAHVAAEGLVDGTSGVRTATIAGIVTAWVTVPEDALEQAEQVLYEDGRVLWYTVVDWVASGHSYYSPTATPFKWTYAVSPLESGGWVLVSADGGMWRYPTAQEAMASVAR